MGMYNSSSSEDNVLTSYQKRRYKELMDKITPSITEILNEEELITKTQQEKMIVHFYNDGFKFCKEIDSALKQVVKDYPFIKFYRIKAELCPLVCEKLHIQVLPFLAFFKGGYFVGQHIGLEKVGDNICDIGMLKDVINKSE